jgi:predicted O-methyltransferase YrrM
LQRPLKQRLSAVRAQLYTLLGLQPRGFFIEYDYVSSVPKRISTYPDIAAYFEADRGRIDDFIAAIASHMEVFESFGAAVNDPIWNRGMFPPIDGAAAYTIVRMFEPRRIIEIGSGSSTHYLVRAARDCASIVDITCIDPAPRRSITELEVRRLERVLTTDDVEFLAALQAHDVIFIDSSHIMLPGMDLDILFNRVFPRLKPGVIVHLHDVFLPDDYPSTWKYRWYSEQNALVGWIISGYFDVIYPGHHAVTRHGSTMDRLLGGFEPLQNRKSGSIWLRRN